MKSERPTIRELSWDSAKFGLRVGEIDLSGVSPADTDACLEPHARTFDLVYVRGASAQNLSEDRLQQWGGQLTDERVTFERILDDLPEPFAPPVPGAIEPAGPGALGDQLVALAPAASAYSRFRRDRNIPDEDTDALYRDWMRSSLSGERADEVLAFVDRDRALGFYTLRIEGSTAHLDLFAVDERHRGKGIGRALMVAGLRGSKERGSDQASVTTQHSNPACRLYRAAGYRLAREETIYHLWPRRGIPPLEGRAQS